MQIGGTLDLISVSIKYSVHDDLKVIRVSNHIVSIFDQGCEWEITVCLRHPDQPEYVCRGGEKALGNYCHRGTGEVGRGVLHIQPATPI